MEKKFTQGRWVIGETDAFGYETEIKGSGGIRICEVKSFTGVQFNDPSMQEREANSKLIAAAPELLEALDECINELYLIHSQYGDQQNANDHCSALTKAEFAIKKALE